MGAGRGEYRLGVGEAVDGVGGGGGAVTGCSLLLTAVIMEISNKEQLIRGYLQWRPYI